MFLVVGLGNPGEKYKNTRHNVGFIAVEQIGNDYQFSQARNKFDGLLCEGEIAGQKLLTFMPMTYMNNSGVPVSKIARFYKIPLDQIIVLHDDLDLPISKIKVKKGGSDGGHNGLKSLDSHIGKDYYRVRIGIDRPVHKEQVASYVLDKFKQDEAINIDLSIARISKLFPNLLNGHIEEFSSKINLS